MQASVGLFESVDGCRYLQYESQELRAAVETGDEGPKLLYHRQNLEHVLAERLLLLAHAQVCLPVLVVLVLLAHVVLEQLADPHVLVLLPEVRGHVLADVQQSAQLELVLLRANLRVAHFVGEVDLPLQPLLLVAQHELLQLLPIAVNVCVALAARPGAVGLVLLDFGDDLVEGSLRVLLQLVDLIVDVAPPFEVELRRKEAEEEEGDADYYEADVVQNLVLAEQAGQSHEQHRRLRVE